jgi:hypothetical protein
MLVHYFSSFGGLVRILEAFAFAKTDVIIGLYVLYTHMMKQRKKVLGSGSGRKLKTL